MPRGRAKSKENGANKSQAIRDMFNTMGKKARPRDLIARLTEKGVDVSPALVSNVLSRTRKRRRGAKVPRLVAAGRGRTTRENHVSMNSLLGAKKLVDQVGSVDEAKKAIDALSRLM